MRRNERQLMQAGFELADPHLLDCQLGKLRRVSNPPLTDLNDLSGYHFGYRIIPIDKPDAAQSLLIGRGQTLDILRSHRDVCKRR